MKIRATDCKYNKSIPNGPHFLLRFIFRGPSCNSALSFLHLEVPSRWRPIWNAACLRCIKRRFSRRAAAIKRRNRKLRRNSSPRIARPQKRTTFLFVPPYRFGRPIIVPRRRQRYLPMLRSRCRYLLRRCHPQTQAACRPASTEVIEERSGKVHSTCPVDNKQTTRHFFSPHTVPGPPGKRTGRRQTHRSRRRIGESRFPDTSPPAPLPTIRRAQSCRHPACTVSFPAKKNRAGNTSGPVYNIEMVIAPYFTGSTHAPLGVT